jgi:hypothetical protein
VICHTLVCDQEATCIVVYGCLNQHLRERYLCAACESMYLTVIHSNLCDQCGEPWAETQSGNLHGGTYENNTFLLTEMQQIATYIKQNIITMEEARKQIEQLRDQTPKKEQMKQLRDALKKETG